ncbi:MAG: tRNA (adenosine(37)-N6)-dimethylallyltransferase MiaA [Ignavibacteria bacterium]|nr:MAG: tRNA (adenosine(37)-N6)-dimethylallyltransferase MiaA [Ignavibacteria bacterium]
MRHHFVDLQPPDHEFNAGEFGRRGRVVIDEIFSRGKVPLVVGGSGLYIQALIDGFLDGVSADLDRRAELYRRLKTEGPVRLLAELARVDPVSAGRMLPSNTRRIVRALEVYQASGVPISELQKDRLEVAFHPVLVGLNWDRAALYSRVDRRVDWMIEEGLVHEVKKLLAKGYPADLNALQTPGYREMFAFLEGKMSFDEAVSAMKRETRRYAKRQLSWFRRDTRIRWFQLRNEGEFSAIASSICSYFLSE